MTQPASFSALRPAPHRAALPVSGLAARWGGFTGHAEALLAEGRAEDPVLALALLRALVVIEDEQSGASDPAELPVSDADVLVCRIRIGLLGDRVVAEVLCHDAQCGQRVDIHFRLSEYLTHHAPRPARGVVADWERQGWYVLGASAQRFRLPRMADLVGAANEEDAERALAQRCLDPADAPARLRQRAERAMEAMAPTLAGPLQGACAECGQAITAHFAARAYCMQELCDRARFLFEDVDAIAARYHWPEAAILDLPAARRSRYAELARRISTVEFG